MSRPDKDGIKTLRLRLAEQRDLEVESQRLEKSISSEQARLSNIKDTAEGVRSQIADIIQSLNQEDLLWVMTEIDKQAREEL